MLKRRGITVLAAYVVLTGYLALPATAQGQDPTCVWCSDSYGNLCGPVAIDGDPGHPCGSDWMLDNYGCSHDKNYTFSYYYESDGYWSRSGYPDLQIGCLFQY